MHIRVEIFVKRIFQRLYVPALLLSILPLLLYMNFLNVKQQNDPVAKVEKSVK